MAQKIVKNYKVAANGILSIDADSQIYISIEDGPQDINLANLLEDFADKSVKLSCSYDEDYTEPKLNIDEETGEVM